MAGSTSTARTEVLRGLLHPFEHGSHRAVRAFDAILDVPDRARQHETQAPSALLLIAAHCRQDRVRRERRLHRQPKERQQRQHAEMLVAAEAIASQRQEPGGPQP
jgi:hypothetical protein